MPFGVKPICSSCKITSSPIWRKGTSGEVLCNSCGLKQMNGVSLNAVSDVESASQNGGQKKGTQAASETGGNGAPVLRKSTRIKPPKKTAPPPGKSLNTKGKGRRIIFKKNAPLRAPAEVATVVTGESVFHKDQYYQIGDVVSLVDHDGDVFYAQLRGFMSDQYNEKSAIITWLLPTVRSPQDRFDPNTYILGPEEDLPRRMEFMEFVCHAPSDYFRAKDAPYKTVHSGPNLCYIWTSIGPKIKVTPTIDEIFGVHTNSNDSRNQDPTTVSRGLRSRRDRKGDGSGLEDSFDSR